MLQNLDWNGSLEGLAIQVRLPNTRHAISSGTWISKSKGFGKWWCMYKTLNIEITRVCLWLDSTITLNWIHTPPHQLKTFTANRVSEIKDITQGHRWRHLPSADNLVDFLSPGHFPLEFIENSICNQGPDWLQQCEDAWPKNMIIHFDIPEQCNPANHWHRCTGRQYNYVLYQKQFT